MQMRRLVRREKELLTRLSAEIFTTLAPEVSSATVRNLEAHKLAVRATVINERGRPVVALRLTAAGAEAAALSRAKAMRRRSEPGDAEE